MRDLLTLIENMSVLDESTGLANRKPGEKWANDQGQQLEFRKLDFFPTGGGAFNSPDELTSAKTKVIDEPKLNVVWTNQPSARSRAFGIATFADQQGNPVYVGKYFQSISPNFANNFWANSDIIPGFKYQSKASRKEDAGYKPSDILSELKSQTPQSLLRQIVAKFGSNSDEAQAFAIFLNSKETPVKVPKGNMQLSAFRDYLGEILQPIALVRGMQVAGNALEAAKNFFGTASYSDCVISFNEGVSGGLYDSLLVNSKNKQIKLSSKGESGAMASVVNFLRCIEELDATPQGKKLRAKHQEVINIIDTIDQGGHFGGPLELAAHYGIIDQNDVMFVPGLKELGPYDEIDWRGHKKLEALYNGRKANNPDTLVPAEHMIAAIAYKVADHVNDNTNFSDAASEILNTSALVQMYTYVKEVGDEFHITFEAKWPSTAVTGVILSAGKTYMSTAKGGGNMVFKILKGGAKDVPDDEEETVVKPSAAKTLAKQTAAVGGRVNIRPKTAGAGATKGVGRATR